ncbi:TIGR04540 family protein [Clostridium pasteurianum]|uniref:TIGR04540 family protein n=1 Tax=Clostridium pasteurianum TaxID=1501 RepID=UPI002260B384|nr:TIGR04540 family protein [Clostridium pasteurianum]UZW16014.1 TIGR04540 family protein [Clostridium pasteurianum]
MIQLWYDYATIFIQLVGGIKINTYYKNQNDIGIALNFIIDSYWNNSITEKEMIEKINSIVENNKEKILRKEGYVTVIIHKCGKKRLELIDKVRREDA